MVFVLQLLIYWNYSTRVIIVVLMFFSVSVSNMLLKFEENRQELAQVKFRVLVQLDLRLGNLSNVLIT